MSRMFLIFLPAFFSPELASTADEVNTEDHITLAFREH